jgi:hypothetical protein
MSSIFRKSSGYCSGCGAVLTPERAKYQQTTRLYCSDCKPLENIVEQWQPMTGRSSIAGIYRIPAKNVITKKQS